MDTQETKIYIAALIAAGVLGVMLIYFVITMIKQQRKTQRLNLEKIHAEILAQEKERKRIAADLHDDLGPLLSAIKFKINSVDLSNEDDKLLIENASEHIDETLDLVRKISFDLMPNTLTRKGLIQALEEFIPKIQKSAPVKIHLKHNDVDSLPNEMKINLYRIILEIINNALKHSKAQNLKIELTQTEKKIILLTSDDGVGFDMEKKGTMNVGLGLRNLQSRTEIMHGELYVETKPGKGVKYCIEIPI